MSGVYWAERCRRSEGPGSVTKHHDRLGARGTEATDWAHSPVDFGTFCKGTSWYGQSHCSTRRVHNHISRCSPLLFSPHFPMSQENSSPSPLGRSHCHQDPMWDLDAFQRGENIAKGLGSCQAAGGQAARGRGTAAPLQRAEQRQQGSGRAEKKPFPVYIFHWATPTSTCQQLQSNPESQFSLTKAHHFLQTEETKLQQSLPEF